MLKAAPLSKFPALMMALALFSSVPLHAEEAVQYKSNKTSLSRDIFDQNIYYDATSYLRFDRLYRKLFHKSKPAKNVNIYDEVSDSSFFTNRHAKSPLSKEALAQGYKENDGPDKSGELTVTRGKFEGLTPGFFVKDSKGDEYLLKFDPADNLELLTATEIIGSRFYYAIGYNVPQNTILVFNPEKLEPSPEAKIIDSTGFKKKLTKEKLEEHLLFIPSDDDGNFRASASKILKGKSLGGMPLQGRRKNDPEDLVDHEDRREIRALQVFASWLSNDDVRQHNTLDVVVDENGQKKIKHYLLDFNSSLGAAVGGPKPPMFNYEYMLDYGETIKAYFGLGLWEKVWQKRWREAGSEVRSPSLGYFDNNYFDPKKFKTQLPHYAFKDLTRADGFWAAKIIMTFSDEDILALVKAGQYSNEADTAEAANILNKRRDIVGRFWFSQAAPLDHFDISSGKLVFEDLAVTYKFLAPEKAAYNVEVFESRQGKRGKKIANFETKENKISLEPQWFNGENSVEIFIRAILEDGKRLSPYVWIQVTKDHVTGIRHED